MKFLEFDITAYSKPYISVRLQCDTSKIIRGAFYFGLKGRIYKVMSKNCFELSDTTFFIHGLSHIQTEKERTQTVSVRAFIAHNTAKAITNKCMEIGCI